MQWKQVQAGKDFHSFSEAVVHLHLHFSKGKELQMIWNGLTLLVQYSTLLLLPQMINKKETLQKVLIFKKPNNSSSIADAVASINSKILVKLQPVLVLQGGEKYI